MVLILDLWAWAIDLGNQDEPPTGDVPGTGAMSARMLAGAVEWTGDPEQLVLALCACGLLEGYGDGKLRVRGMDRYRRTWEKNRRKGHGNDGSRQEPGKNPAPARQEPTAPPAPQTQMKRKIEDDDVDIEPTPEAVALVEVWNQHKAPEMPAWRVPRSKKRLSHINARLGERPDLAEWREVVQRLARSDFARGRIPGRDGRLWIADPTFLLRPDSADKVLEGTYDNRGPARSAAAQEEACIPL